MRQKKFAGLSSNKVLKDAVLVLALKSIRLDPELAYGYGLLGNIYAIDLDDTKTGLAYIEKAIQLDPHDPDFLAGKGSILADKQNNHIEALGFYGEALQKEPSESYVWLLRLIGLSYLRVGEFELAEQFYNEALELQPDALLFLAELSHKKGEFPTPEMIRT